MKSTTRHRIIMGKKLLCFFSVIFLLSLGSVEAKQKHPFRVENDTILHICSNLSEMDCWSFVATDCLENPSDYFIFPYWGFKNIVIDEGVDSVFFDMYLISAKSLSIPSSLKTLYFPNIPGGLEEVRLSPKNPYFRWENGALYNRDKTSLYFMLPNAEDSVLLIPETVKQVWALPTCYYPKDTDYLKDLPAKHWVGYLERYPKDIHYSKIVFPKQCERYPYYIPSCDSLIIQSEYCPELSEYDVDRFSYLYCLPDSAVTHFLMKDSWNRIRGYKDIIDRGKFHCPNYDVRKRDTSWMRENYRLTCILDNGDTLVGVDTIPSGRYIESEKIEGIVDEKVERRREDDVYRFYIPTYDTVYCLPLEVPKEKKPEPKWSDYGEVKDSVLIIREDVDSLPYLRGSFRKVIIPKRTHYLRGSIECDSAFIYSDSLEWSRIDAQYYYVENEDLYLEFKRINQSAVVYSPNADISKRNMELQQRSKPVWLNYKNGKVMDLTYHSISYRTRMWADMGETFFPDLYVFDCQRGCLLRGGNHNMYYEVINDGRTFDLEYAVWTYDTLLPLQQKDTVKLLKRDGSPWGIGHDRKECVFYYVPKGESKYSILESGQQPLLMWRSGDTIPRRYTKRLAFGFLLTNGECGPSAMVRCHVLCLDKRNYFGTGNLVQLKEKYLSEGKKIRVDSGIRKIPSRYKEIWLDSVAEYSQDCIPKGYPPMHFYIGK